MENIDEMNAELRELNEKANEINQKRHDLRMRIATARAVFKVGDCVTYAGAKYVWKITSVGFGYDNKPKYIGAKLKKDGTPGARAVEIYVPFRKELCGA